MLFKRKIPLLQFGGKVIIRQSPKIVIGKYVEATDSDAIKEEELMAEEECKELQECEECEELEEAEELEEEPKKRRFKKRYVLIPLMIGAAAAMALSSCKEGCCSEEN